MSESDLEKPGATLSEAEARFERRKRTVGLVLGPAVFVLLMLFPIDGLTLAQSRLSAILLWIVLWWITEAIPIPMTALLGPMLAVICGVGGVKEMFAPFGSPIIFLFLGSFIIAQGMFASGLDRRFAFAILTHRFVGSSTTRIVVAFAVSIAALSMWLSNTATTAMMCPIAIGVLGALAKVLSESSAPDVDPTRLRFGTGMMLATAYAASIGGTATPVGSPPNLVALGQLKSLAKIQIPFFQWTAVALPITVVMLGALLLYLRWALPPEIRDIGPSVAQIREKRATLGPLGRAEWNVLVAFAITVGLWVLPGVLAVALGTSSKTYLVVQAHLPEGVVALLGAGLLFVLPVNWKQREFSMSWRRAARIDWGTLLLFGGGLSLGQAMFRTDLAKHIGQGMVDITGASSTESLTFLFAIVAVFGTEVASNTAAATMLCPLAIASAIQAGVSPVAPAIATALGCGMAFMLPVSTPPNAIVYGSGCVRLVTMARHGLFLDLVAVLVVPSGVLLGCRLFGL